ncbi:MAG: NTP transferase domain-containing protein [Deltaproteobacteria bacterium]|nr:NTP transferase domain-containing protein [Deltaproteobacteria bacterium]MCL5276224.1 NTP transferase domain-containing protein [Deltaproteobacteria bacterium]
MANLHVLIAAAGKGVRAGLPYPKTLFSIQGKPILVRIHELMSAWDTCPTVIVSPTGYDQVISCVAQYGLTAYLVIQQEPRGMGDAVLRFKESPAFPETEHVLLIWGDIPFIQLNTVTAMVNSHYRQGNDFTFVTRYVDTAYTVVERDTQGSITGVIETREAGIKVPQHGERDIGLFIFRKQPIWELLQEELPGKWGKTTDEHGFLYVIRHMIERGYRVQGLPIATEMDLVSFNTMKDIENFL